jgi:hypothetical protein
MGWRRRGFIVGVGLVYLVQGFASAQPRTRNQVLAACEARFGPPIPDLLLFEVGRNHVARIDFDQDDQAQTITVSSKYGYRDSFPEWGRDEDRHDLGSADFDRLLANLDAIRPRGAFVSTNDIRFVVFNATHAIDQYENAVVRFGETAVDPKVTSGDGKGRRLVRYLEVEFSDTAPRQDRSRDDVLRRAVQVIGPRGTLEQADVQPKFMFSDTHPDWRADRSRTADPLAVLTARDFERVLAGLAELRALGARRGNARATDRDSFEQRYAGALVTWVDGRVHKGAPARSVFWFSVRWDRPPASAPDISPVSD